MAALLIIIAIIYLAYFFYLAKYDKELQKEREILDKREVAMDEEKNRLSEDRLALREKEQKALHLYLEHKLLDEQSTFEASYTVTESDLMKYTTDQAIEKQAKKSIAMTISNDIVRRFLPTVDEVDGKMRFVLKIKVKEAE